MPITAVALSDVFSAAVCGASGIHSPVTVLIVPCGNSAVGSVSLTSASIIILFALVRYRE